MPGPTIVITGPTGSGKASLAVALARRLEVPIISLDSMKVYRRMDIGTAKPSAEKLQGVPCHQIDLREPWEPFSVGDYVTELRSIAADLPKPWLFCGGTAFYLYALTAGIFDAPAADDEIRERLQAECDADGPAALHARLRELDPDAADKLHPNDTRRVIRALEVIELCGEPLTVLQAKRAPFLAEAGTRLIGVRHSREDLYSRIDARVERMFEAGWVDEVAALVAEHDPPWSPQASQSIGYEQIREALASGEDPTERIPAIQQRTRNFAQAQLKWFRKMPIEWWGPEEREGVFARVDGWLEEWQA